jgi:hypothetical protein
MWGLGGCLRSGENFDFVFVLRFNVVVLGGGFKSCSPLLPLLDSGPGAESVEVPSCQQGLEPASVWVLEGKYEGGGGACIVGGGRANP